MKSRPMQDILYELSSVIDERRSASPEESYTAKLFSRGQDFILKKIGEEASEVILASKNCKKDEIIYESADLLFHLMAILRYHDISIDQVLEELSRRRKGTKLHEK